MKPINPIALFRLSVLGPLASRDCISKGELKQIIADLSQKSYAIPNSKNSHISSATLERWYYKWRQGGVDALAPAVRKDAGKSQITLEIQEAIIAAKNANQSRSVNSIIRLLEMNGDVSKKQLSRTSVYRLLKAHGLSARIMKMPETIERRSFVAEYACQIWQGDVLHGPQIIVGGRLRKTYLVSFMDDASRLIVHSEFRLGEAALDIQCVLKQALLKRGVPNRIILDNGSAYRSGDLQSICARLQIRLVYCRPYDPQGKGKLERWHSRMRSEFLNEVDFHKIINLADLNTRLWAYIDQIYHVTPHEGLAGKITPIERWRQDFSQIRQLGTWALNIDELFYHRVKRLVRKDGSVSIHGKSYEVPYELTGQEVLTVFDPDTNVAKWVESIEGKRLGGVTPLDLVHNNKRKRQRPTIEEMKSQAIDSTTVNPIELAFAQQQKSLCIKLQQGK